MDMLIKQKHSMTFLKLSCQDFCRIANSVLNKGKSAIPPLFNGPEVLSAPDKAKLFAKNFSKNSNRLGICYLFLLHDFSMTSKIVKKVITNVVSSKVSGPDCIPVVVLKNCQSELFNMYLKKSYFQIAGRFHWWSLYLRIFGKGLLLKTTALLVFFLWSVKSFKT